MKRLSRRQFAKIMGQAAAVVPLLPSLVWPQEPVKRPQPPPETPATPPPTELAKPEPRPKLTAKLEEAVQKAIERRDRQLAPMRSRTLPYDAEPAFVFRVRRRPRSPRKVE
ncbi:MAG TPA: hypothetical protein VKE24_05680 [Candidatus Acidoferrales bacterium]|nr:hypothetical protein [Candidatus Acidoferrales bacterium]